MRQLARCLDVANGRSRQLAQQRRDIVEVQRNACRAETTYFEPSRLSDIELSRQGMLTTIASRGQSAVCAEQVWIASAR